MKKVAGILWCFFFCYSFYPLQADEFITPTGGELVSCYKFIPDTSMFAKTNHSNLYNPVAAGFLAIVPGMGHIYLHEPLTGLAFLGGTGLAYGLTAFASNYMYEVAYPGLLTIMGLYITNNVSAVKTAKAKNQIINNRQFSLQVFPSVKNYVGTCCKNNFGLTLRLML